MYTAVQGVSWLKGKIQCQIFLLLIRMPWPWKKNVQDETVACSEKKGRKKTDLISLSLWKNGRGLLFWNHISLKTLWKLNKIDRVGFIVSCSFVFDHQCLCLCHGNARVIYLYRPFTITSLSWPNNRGNIRSSLFLPLMIRSIRAQYFRGLRHSRMCVHTQSCYWWETYSLWLDFRLLGWVYVFLKHVLFFNIKGKGRWWLSIYSPGSES